MTAKNAIKKSNGDKIFDIVNITLLIIITIVVAYPLYFTIIASLSNPAEVSAGTVMFTPVDFCLDAYKYVFQDDRIWSGYANSIFYTSLSTLYCLCLTIPAAYVLSKKDIPFRWPMMVFFLITMYFSGGMIPSYINISNLGLIDTPWVMILGIGVTCRNLIISRQYFSSSVPNEVYEAAAIDGASQIKSFIKIALPLAKPIIAVMALYYAVNDWNTYMRGMLYLKDSDLYPLQVVIRNILIENQVSDVDLSSGSFTQADVDLLIYKDQLVEAMRYSTIFISSAPLLIAYPFVQKFFVKGVMVGSVKG
ncbi:MAG: carbohydrate ABC transporter permease [Clostridia bacterium]